MVLSSDTSHCHLMNVKQCQAAADPQTKPADLGCESTVGFYRLHPSTIVIYFYSAPKADTHFTLVCLAV